MERWRLQAVNELISKNIFFSKPNIYDLNTNFRSSKEIVNFNNTLFLNISKILKKNNDISNIFNFPKQKSYSKKTGYISLDFFDKKIIREMILTVSKLKRIFKIF